MTSRGILRSGVRSHSRDARGEPRSSYEGPRTRCHLLRHRRHPGAHRQTSRGVTRARGGLPAAGPTRAPLRVRRVRVRAGRRPRRAGWSASGSIAYVGSHGAEVMRAAGATRPSLVAAFASWEGRVRRFVREREERRELQLLRIRIEDKGPIKAFHWRGAPDEDAAETWLTGVAQEAEADGLGDPLGPQGARDPAAGARRQGPGDNGAPRGLRRCEQRYTEATT